MAHHKPKCFLLIPNKEFALPLKRALRKKGISIHTQFDQESDEQLSLNSFDAAIAFFENPRGDNPGQPTHRAVYFSNRNDSEDLIEAQKDGLYDFSKIQSVNLNAEKIISHLEPILLGTAKTSQNRTTIGEKALEQIIGRSAAMKHVKEMIQRISQFPDVPMLITGETGTGKELVANALHACSPRSDKLLIKINCSAIPETLFESQLFGHRKGAFSGAAVQQKGLVEEATDGTLFLDEIGSLKLDLQPKLLRFLEDGSYLPIGEIRERKSNAWIIAATNQDLDEQVEEGLFRTDLLHRLKAAKINLPPLRERGGDILILSQYLLNLYSQSLGIESQQLSQEVQDSLMGYDWPGNIRELKNLIHGLVLNNPGGGLYSKHLLKRIPVKGCQSEEYQKVPSLKEMEKSHIVATFNGAGRRIRKTAQLLGIARNTLKKKLSEYGIHKSL